MTTAFSEPAFPTSTENLGENPGMSLRDYFAAKALQGMCADSSTAGTKAKDLCKECYLLADAMLAARVKP
ncbi:hypothetical protein [Pseudomonas sp.]|uniref:hypothetical protein n=1 Tax=Pseudomonas sp. TaxID=306 RepID=UPI0028AC0B85|nr:hypothetical protein [Pseudomonas sp.]